MKELITGSKPKLYIVETAEQIKTRIAERIRYFTEQGLQQKNIVILTVKTTEDSLLANETSIGGIV